MATITRVGLDQFLELPETEPASEYLCGEVIQKPMPTSAHGMLQLYLGMVLLQFLSRTGLGMVVSEWRCIFGPAGRERALVPDLAVALKGRLPAGDLRDNPYLRVAPDLAIEILSPGQVFRPFLDKIVFYLLYGVRLIWVIDPLTETVLVLRPAEEPVTLTTDDVLDATDLLPGFSLPVRELFAQLNPAPATQ